jgi:hypothetical protein
MVQPAESIQVSKMSLQAAKSRRLVQGDCSERQAKQPPILIEMEEVTPDTEQLLSETGWKTPTASLGVAENTDKTDMEETNLPTERADSRRVSNDAASVSVLVGDPIKQGEGAEAYTLYLVTTARSEGPTTSVRRRFSDFVWLHKELLEEFPACIIPPIPGKQQMSAVFTP